MIRLKMKNVNMVLTKKQGQYQHYRQEKLIHKNILQVKKYHPRIKEEGQKWFRKTNKNN